MQWYDWVIVIIPVLFVFWMGYYTRRYLKDMTTFLSAGRVCGRYVISMGNLANALSIIGLLAFVEVHYKTGFSVGFWYAITLPVGVAISLFGYCTYRFRETKAQSIGEFLEVRYSRKFRIFAAALRSLSEMLANMIMPALAARFFMYFLGFPDRFQLLGMTLNTFDVIMVVVLVMAISIICVGGSMSIIVTDTLQGFLCYPLMVLFVIFVLCKFSWFNEILPVVENRVAGESFLNPYDAFHLKDFNYFSVLVIGVFSTFMHACSWSGAGGGAARSAHEQKMAGLLGTWRSAIGSIFYILLAIALITFLNHKDFMNEAHVIRGKLTNAIASDIFRGTPVKDKVVTAFQNQKAIGFNPGVDAPQADKHNVDTAYLAGTHKAIIDGVKAQMPDGGKSKESAEQATAKGNKLFQQFRTLYYQQMLPVTLRNMLPGGMLGLFCLLMIMAMVSTDDSRIFSATVTISQDVIMPFVKREISPRQHMNLLRWVAVGIGVFFFFGSKYMSQLDYINMYVTLVCSMWLGGCGPVIIFGLYSRFGNAIGAWFSLIGGMVLAIVGVVVQRNWADVIVPFLNRHELYDLTGTILKAASRPFNPWVDWQMDAIKCPINSYEWYFITMLITLFLYCFVSWLTGRGKEKFNLERMLHRGIYSTEGEKKIKSAWSWQNLYNKLIGITPEYTFWDRVIAWAYFYYAIVFRFGLTFIVVVIWNVFYPWPLSWWGWYFLILTLIIPCFMAAFTGIWFGICGTIDLRDMFRALEARVPNHLDDGRVSGNVSLADKAAFEKIEAEAKQAETEKQK